WIGVPAAGVLDAARRHEAAPASRRRAAPQRRGAAVSERRHVVPGPAGAVLDAGPRLAPGRCRVRRPGPADVGPARDLGEDGVHGGRGEVTSGAGGLGGGSAQPIGSATRQGDGRAVGPTEVAVAGRGGPGVGPVGAVGDGEGADGLDAVVGGAERTHVRRGGLAAVLPLVLVVEVAAPCGGAAPRPDARAVALADVVSDGGGRLVA